MTASSSTGTRGDRPEPEPLSQGDQQLARRWALGWLGAAGIGVTNGVLREALTRSGGGSRISDRTGHQLSTLSVVGLLAAYAELLNRVWPLPDARLAARIGGVWAALTVAFEFGFGRTVGGQSWRELLADYDVRRGRFWIAVPVTMALAPGVTARGTTRWPGKQPR